MLQGTAWSLVSQGWNIGGGSSGTLSSSVPLHVMVGRYYWLQRCWWRLALPAAAVHLATRSADLGFTGAGSRVRVPALCTRTLAAHWGTRTRDLGASTGLGNPTFGSERRRHLARCSCSSRQVAEGRGPPSRELPCSCSAWPVPERYSACLSPVAQVSPMMLLLFRI